MYLASLLFLFFLQIYNQDITGLLIGLACYCWTNKSTE